jgi:hypothetical protein
VHIAIVLCLTFLCYFFGQREFQVIVWYVLFLRILTHYCFTVPAVERVVYSTCSIHQRENEDVIESILPHANALNFYLATPFPEWPHRGLPVFEGGG